MSILDKIFGSANTQPAQPAATAAPAQQPATVPPNQGNIPAVPTTPVDPNNPTAPDASTINNPIAETEQKDDSPLAEFSSLWDTEPKKEGDIPAAPAALTAESLQKVMAKADFSKAITPEQMTAITAGGEEAGVAFAQAMNSVVQQAMTQSILISEKLRDDAVQQAIEATEAKIPALLRSQAAADHAKTSNPIFSNPAVKPVIEATQAQLLDKFPNATPTEVTKMTQDYIIAMGAEFAPKSQVNDTATGETDWDAYIKM